MENQKKIIHLAGDHAGFELKEHLIGFLNKKGYALIDHGPLTPESVDYPDFGHILADAMKGSLGEIGIAICGSGNGINMVLNHHPEIRSALAWKPELAALAKQHNDANVLALPARFITKEEGEAIVTAFLEAEFEGGRHQRRVAKINP